MMHSIMSWFALFSCTSTCVLYYWLLLLFCIMFTITMYCIRFVNWCNLCVSFRNGITNSSVIYIATSATVCSKIFEMWTNVILFIMLVTITFMQCTSKLLHSVTNYFASVTTTTTIIIIIIITVFALHTTSIKLHSLSLYTYCAFGHRLSCSIWCL